MLDEAPYVLEQCTTPQQATAAQCSSNPLGSPRAALEVQAVSSCTANASLRFSQQAAGALCHSDLLGCSTICSVLSHITVETPYVWSNMPHPSRLLRWSAAAACREDPGLHWECSQCFIDAWLSRVNEIVPHPRRPATAECSSSLLGSPQAALEVQAGGKVAVVCCATRLIQQMGGAAHDL